MKIRLSVACSALLFHSVGAESSIDYKNLKKEFNVSNYWHKKMRWSEFLDIRNSLQRKGLIKYVDKIEQQKMAREVGLNVPKTYCVSREKVPFLDIISTLPTYVAKMTHLSMSQGLIIVKNGINIVTGERITPEEVQERVFNSFEMKPRKVESWALHQVEPGFIIQEYIPNRREVKVQTVWGKALGGEWRGSERCATESTIFGIFTRDGKKIPGPRNETPEWDPQERVPKWWPQAMAAAELLAEGTDALRVDFLVRENGELLVNELEIWPETWWSELKEDLIDRLNYGYRNMPKREKRS